MHDDSMSGPTSAAVELANDFVRDDPTLGRGHAVALASGVVAALARTKPDAPTRHSKQTPACVLMDRYMAVQTGGAFTAAEEAHFAGCAFCRRNRELFFPPAARATGAAGRRAGAGEEIAAGDEPEADIAEIDVGAARRAALRDLSATLELAAGSVARVVVDPAVTRGDAPTPAVTTGGWYHAGEVIGRGGMGTVYRAAQRGSGRAVAIKMMRGGPSDARADLRFRREVRALMAVEHPNVMPPETAAGRGRACVVTPLCRGETLDDRLQTGPWPWPSAAEVACQIADGLAAVHAAGACHRDLKPSNVLLSYAGGGRTARVMDFGLARASTPAATPSARARAERLMGTPGYMAPEQTRGEPGDARSDVFALGVIVFQMMFGAEVPGAGGPLRWNRAGFCGQPGPRGPFVVLAQHQFDARLRDPAASAPERRLLALTRAALAPDPAARPTARALADELRALLPRPVPRPGAVDPADPPAAVTPIPELWAELFVTVQLIATFLTGSHRTVFVDADEIAQDVLTELVQRATRDTNLMTDLTSPVRDHLLAAYCRNALRDARQAEQCRREFRSPLPDAEAIEAEFPIFSRPLFSERFLNRGRTPAPPEQEPPEAPRRETDVDRSLLLKKVLDQSPTRALALLKELRRSRDRSPGQIAATLTIS